MADLQLDRLIAESETRRLRAQIAATEQRATERDIRERVKMTTGRYTALFW